MERYFVGNNTAFGYKGYYEEQMKLMSQVILLKGGPGTGKSTILKRIAKEAKDRGYDFELWYCSGDPSSLDGVYVKDIAAAVVDATAPHATGADLPAMRDFVIDLASSLDSDKLKQRQKEIEALFKSKKQHFMRVYHHLNTAFCHRTNVLELEKGGVNEAGIRSLAAVLASSLRKCGDAPKRRLFASAISPHGENCYFDHLRGRRIYRVIGSTAAANAFFDELSHLVVGGITLLDPLDPDCIEGIVLDGAAVVKNVGHFGSDVYETINLGVYENFEGIEGIEEEANAEQLEIAFAVQQLDRARELHLAAETYFVGAMDFDKNAAKLGEILGRLYG